MKCDLLSLGEQYHEADGPGAILSLYKLGFEELVCLNQSGPVGLPGFREATTFKSNLCAGLLRASGKKNQVRHAVI